MEPRKKIKKVLIANRGEIALRIMRTIKKMNLQSTVIFERPDSQAYLIMLADEPIMIGDGPIVDYCNIDKVIWAAKKTGADAIHPGVGFLAENLAFCEACQQAGITFIGPPPTVMRRMGNKVLAKGIMKKVGIPVLPGTGIIGTGEEGLQQAMKFAWQHEYPIIVKSSTGGGGKGIRKIRNDEELVSLLPLVRAEALRAFHDGDLFVEKYIESPRHIEIPVLVDNYGNVVTFGSRDCSIQRRHQKLLSVAPADLPEDVLGRMTEAAILAVRTADCVNAVSVEFLVDPETNAFWFMEINPRLQVEHTITEELLNIDIIREQIRIAEGYPLEIPEERVRFYGKAVQVRIYAEDPYRNFTPDGGTRVGLYLPPGGPGIRLDSIVYQGYDIPPEYDQLIAKMTVRAYDWGQMVSRLKNALDLFLISGPKTTIPLYRAICAEADFKQGRFDTDYLAKHPEVFYFPSEPSLEIIRLEEFLTEIHTRELFPYSWL